MTLRQSLTYQPVELSFGTSGLRGLVIDMTDLECYINVRGFLDFLKQNEALPDNAVISVAGDLRNSTPRILGATLQAIEDAGYQSQYCGLIPTPALALWAKDNNQPCIMVTGSHIPDNRNGIKFYKASGEILKEDEAAIQQAVAQARRALYDSSQQLFQTDGSLLKKQALPKPLLEPRQHFIDRFLKLLPARMLRSKHIVVYQHSAVGRDLLVEVLEALGARVTPVGRSDIFISIDTENVTPSDQNYFRSFAQLYPDAFAIVSTDGDSDRPFLIDETGEFHRGDVLGVIVAQELNADFAAIPVSSSDAVDTSLTNRGIRWQHTKIGSPYVISAMQAALQAKRKRVVGWEVNGGFLTGTPIEYQSKILTALPTRDAFLPLLIALSAAIKQSVPISHLFTVLPQRFTQAGLLDNFPQLSSQKIIAVLSTKNAQSTQLLRQCFTKQQGFDEIKTVDTTDGVRLTFSNQDIAHIRPSGNAPQLRIYSVANSQKRADQIVELSLKTNGILNDLKNAV